MKSQQHDMMVWTWCGWEPLQFYRRLGGFHEAQEGNALWADDWRALLDSEVCAEKLADAGINWVTTHFFKGFGLEAEAEEIAATQRMIAHYHRHGVKVFTYMQYGTVMPETILAEAESAASWGRVDWNGLHDGHPYEYGDQYWRAKPCANQPGFRDYLLQCVDTAIDIGADGIWIDNLQADGCHCSCCQAAFQGFLREYVTDPWRELGLRDISKVLIPRAERPRDPVYQAWVQFRCEETRRSLRLLAERARTRKPDAVVAVNIGIGNHQRALLENGNWFGDLDCVDYTYAENNRFPRWNDTAIISQHWPMGIGESLGIRIVPGAGSPGERIPCERSLRRSFAESAMLGNHALGSPWGLRGEDGGADPLLLRDAAYRRMHRRLVDWYAGHQAIFAGSTNAAPVAILYSREAMSWDETPARAAFEAMSQLLMQQQIPFRYLLSDRLAQLSDVALLILPHVLPVSEAQAATITAFVARGGKVLATGRTSLYDERMRQRRDYALADVLGCTFDSANEHVAAQALLLNPVNGCLFLPGAWGVGQPEAPHTGDVAPDRIARAIRQMLAPTHMPSVLSPVPQVGTTWRRLPDGRHLLGLLNYGDLSVPGITLHGTGQSPALQYMSLDEEAMPLNVIQRAPGTWQAVLPTLSIEGFVMMGTSGNDEVS